MQKALANQKRFLNHFPSDDQTVEEREQSDKSVLQTVTTFNRDKQRTLAEQALLQHEPLPQPVVLH